MKIIECENRLLKIFLRKITTNYFFEQKKNELAEENLSRNES